MRGAAWPAAAPVALPSSTKNQLSTWARAALADKPAPSVRYCGVPSSASRPNSIQA